MVTMVTELTKKKKWKVVTWVNFEEVFAWFRPFECEGKTRWFTMGLPKGVWKTRQSCSRMDAKGIDGDFHGRAQTRNCWEYTDVQSKFSKEGNQPCSHMGWANNSPIKNHLATIIQLITTGATNPNKNETSNSTETYILGRNAKKACLKSLS